MSRDDCINFLIEHDLEIPGKSSCVFCPYKDKRSWIELVDSSSNDLAKALAVDEQIRNSKPGEELFVHYNARPLLEAVAIAKEKANDINEECGSGYCFM